VTAIVPELAFEREQAPPQSTAQVLGSHASASGFSLVQWVEAGTYDASYFSIVCVQSHSITSVFKRESRDNLWGRLSMLENENILHRMDNLVLVVGKSLPLIVRALGQDNCLLSQDWPPCGIVDRVESPNVPS
jgi:hypothetical protein